MSAASASASPNAVKTIPSLDSGGIGCTSTRCVITGSNNTTGGASTAVVNASNEAVKLGPHNRYPKSYVPFYVSCYSGKLCYSSGFNATSTGSELPEVIQLNPKTGAPGKAVKLPLADTGLVDLGVACYSSTQCAVVGAVTKGTGGNQTTHAAYVIINKGKIRRPVVVSRSPGSDLTAVACASLKECYAIGTYYDPKTNSTPTLLAKV
jgi:hypothetical protein